MLNVNTIGSGVSAATMGALMMLSGHGVAADNPQVLA